MYNNSRKEGKEVSEILEGIETFKYYLSFKNNIVVFRGEFYDGQTNF